MSSRENAGKLRGVKPVNSATATVRQLDYPAYVDWSSDVVKRIAASTPGGLKGAAHVAKVNVRTLESIAQKRNGMSGLTLTKLFIALPGFEGALRELSQREAEGDPELQRRIAELVQWQLERSR